MKNKLILGIVALIIVAGGAGVIAQRNKTEDKKTSTSQTTQVSSTPTVKSETEKKFESYVGDDYDRYFMANMIAHHQGAVDMAKMAQTSAKHTELKTMANDIITAQTGEINSMVGYQQIWGYPASSGDMMMDHSAMGMEDDNASMMKALEGKTGDDFDKAFVEQMIMHHTSAIDMSKPAAKNAKHDEVKTLAANIISAQTKEIAQMKQWQKDWGYNS